MIKYDAMFTPFKVGDLEIKNRVVLCAMTGTALLDKTEFNRKTAAYYMERAKGGAGLIISGCSVVYDMFGRDIWVHEHPEVFRGPIKKLMDDIHSTGAKFFMQIGAGLGRVANLEVGATFEGTNVERVQFASSELPNVWEKSRIHREITTKEIEKIVNGMIETAYLAKQANIDGVEIHAVHEGYLLDQFAIRNMNNRSDEYGGTLENRVRFATDIIRGIKKRCGEDYPVSVRFGVESMMKGFNRGALPEEAGKFYEFGRTKEESVLVAQKLVDAGCDLLNADNGTYDSWYWAHPPVYMKPACNVDAAAYLKKHINVPVVCAGRMEDPELANRVIKDGLVDAVGIARQLLADPEYPNKVREGRIEDIRPCIACHNGCLGSLLNGKGVTCALRPATMHEEEYVLTPAEIKKKVMIVGGGIGGMEVARITSMRGHETVLYEASDKLGGTFIAASMPSFKEADKDLIKWYEREIEKSGTIVHMNIPATEDTVIKEKPDVLIIATGAAPVMLSVPVSGAPNIITAKELLMNGCELEGDTVIIGGGLTGCEVAYELALHGTPAKLVEALPEIMAVKGLSMANRSMLMDYLNYYNVEVFTSARVEEIRENSVVLQHEGETKVIPAKNVVMSVGSEPDAMQIAGSGVNEVYVVGDAEKVGNLMTVIKNAYEVAMDI